MKIFILYWLLLRYRVALMIILFMLIGVSWHHRLTTVDGATIIGILALASSYVCATSINDIADRKIDQINHPGNQSRPLVTGKASVSDLRWLFCVASILAVILALSISLSAAGIIALSIGISIAYSLPPIQLSYRTFLAPLSLAVAYVCIPYWLGVTLIGETITVADLPLVGALYFLFAGRIILKDFRDRAGDATYGKPTFLLKYGKPATCSVSLVAIGLGDGLLITTLHEQWWLAIVLQSYIAGVVAMLYRLYQVSGDRDEQLSIGVGARMGNGLLITLLGAFTLASYGANWIIQLIFCLSLIAIYIVNFLDFLQHPDQAIIGYKG